MATETELKIEVGDLQLLDCILTCPAVREKQLSEFCYVQMQATYFDTAEGALGAKGQMLRLRKENARSVVTLKTKAEGRSRGEWEVEGEILSDALAALETAGAPVQGLEGDALLPICGASYTRILTVLQFDDGTAAELCGDLGEIFAGGRHAPICELELELKAGSEQTMLAFGRMLMETFAVREGTVSKFARARALREG